MRGFFVLLITFVLTAGAFAADLDTDSGARKADSRKRDRTVQGRVIAVDAAAQSITVKSSTRDETITANASMLSGIKVGDRVTVRYAVKDGKGVAKAVKKVSQSSEKKGRNPEGPAKK